MIFKKRQYKLVVVDTSALMLFPEILKAKMCLFFIPITAVRQLDGLKNSPDPKKNGASRHASRLIEEGQQEGQVFILDQFVKIEGLDNASDNKIIGAAIQLAADNPGRKLVLLTTDKNMRFVANGHGIISVILKMMSVVKGLFGWGHLEYKNLSGFVLSRFFCYYNI